MGKSGPKEKLTESLGDAFVRLSKEGKTLDQVAEILGVSSRTLSRWIVRHEELRLAVREARFKADEKVEAALFSRAIGYSHPETKFFCDKGVIVTEETVKQYPPDTQAAMFWLRNRQPEKWKEKADGDVNVNNVTNVQGLTDEQLDAKLAALLAKSKSKRDDSDAGPE